MKKIRLEILNGLEKPIVPIFCQKMKHNADAMDKSA